MTCHRWEQISHQWDYCLFMVLEQLLTNMYLLISLKETFSFFSLIGVGLCPFFPRHCWHAISTSFPLFLVGFHFRCQRIAFENSGIHSKPKPKQSHSGRHSSIHPSPFTHQSPIASKAKSKQSPENIFKIYEYRSRSTSRKQECRQRCG